MKKQQCSGCRDGIRWLVAALTALVHVPIAMAQPATESRLHWVTNGTVAAAAVHDHTLYIGGTFTRVAPAGNALGSWFGVSATTGAALPRLPSTDGAVLALESDGAGGYFVGGRFASIGGVTRTGLAHVLADGSIDPAFAPVFQPMTEPMSLRALREVRTLARSGSVLYAGGGFTAAAPGGELLTAAVALDTATATVQPWTTGAAVPVDKILADGDSVFVLASSALDRPTVSAFDTTSGAQRWRRTVGGGTVLDAVRAGSRLIVVGNFSDDDPTAIGLVASLDPATGGVDTAWGPHRGRGDGQSVQAVAVVGSTVYVGGAFSSLGGAARANVAAIDLQSGTLTAWAPAVDGTVRDLAVSGTGTVWAAGTFTHIGTLEREALAELDQSGAATAWTASAYTTEARTLLPAGASLLVAGPNAVAGGEPRAGLAAFRLDTDTLTSWAPTSPGSISQIAVGGQRVFVGGRHAITQRNFLIAYEASDGLPAPWTSPAADIVSLLGVVDGHVYLALNTALIYSLVRVGADDGVVDSTWRHAAFARAMTVNRDVVYLLDTFQINGVLRDRLAAVHLRSGALSDWSPALPPTPPSMPTWTPEAATVTGRTFIVSHFNQGPLGPHGISAFDAITGLRVHFPVTTAGRVTDLAAVDDLVITVQAPDLPGPQAVVAYRPDGAPALWNPALSLSEREPYGALPPRLLATESDVVVVGVQSTGPGHVQGIAVYARGEGAAPSALNGEAIDHEVELSWRTATPAPVTHRLEVGSRAGASDLLVQDTGSASGRLDAVAPFGTYFVRVRQPDSAGGAGPATNEIALRVGCTQPPVAAPGRIAIHTSGTHVTVTWDPDPFVAVARYVLEAGASPGTANLARITVPGTASRFEVDAPPGTYFVRMRAANVCGLGPPTPDVWLTVGAESLPTAPTGLNVRPVGPAFPTPAFVAEWASVPGATGYILEAGTQPGASDLAVIQTAEPRLGPATVPYGRAYFVRVRAIASAGVGPPSREFVILAQ